MQITVANRSHEGLGYPRYFRLTMSDLHTLFSFKNNVIGADAILTGCHTDKLSKIQTTGLVKCTINRNID